VRTANPSVAPRASVGSTPLLDVVRRGVASADGVPTTSKEQLFVTVDLEDLRRRTNAGTVLGTTEPGCLLGLRLPELHGATSWCDGHHLRHWVDGGASDLDNGGAALRAAPHAGAPAELLRPGR
jgi:hypothetical protein